MITDYFTGIWWKDIIIVILGIVATAIPYALATFLAMRISGGTEA